MTGACAHTVYRRHYLQEACRNAVRWIIVVPHDDPPVLSCQQHLGSEIAAAVAHYARTTTDPSVRVRPVA